MTERRGDENIVDLVAKAMNSGNYDVAFDESNPLRRKEIIAELEKRAKSLRRRNSILTKKEQQTKTSEQEIRLKPNERRHPEHYVRRISRRDGLYLDFSQDKVETSIVSVQKYLEALRPHVGRYGEGSIANLCPSKPIFIALTSGVELRSHASHTKEVMAINTIEDLKSLRSILVDDTTVMVYRHNPQALTRSKALNLNNLFIELDWWEENQRSKKI